jgi:hypothetical protein
MTSAFTRVALVLGILVAIAQPAQGQETQTVPVTRAGETSYGCLVCHAEKRRAFVEGVHSEWGIRCHDCHGGNPVALEVEPAHAGEYVGAPDKLQTVAICSKCHSDPDQMRQYGLPSDQFTELRTSRHGQLLEVGNQDAPTCSDCHDPHTTLPSTDARSATFPTNIPKTCGRCHTDAAMMEPYGLAIDQLEEFQQSTHGRAIFEDGNFAAPSCIGCHGSHAALPPGVGEIANVCGRCHIDVRQALASGPHGGSADTGNVLLGCTACHTNHGTETVDSEMIAETCMHCHAEGDRATMIGEQIEEMAVRTEHDMESAREAIGELGEAGRQTSDARFLYRGALTEFRQIARVQHGLDMEHLTDLELKVSSFTKSIEASAEVAAEERWEHRLLLIPLWFFALSIAVLAHFRLRRA